MRVSMVATTTTIQGKRGRMKIIDADELEPDTEWDDYYDDFVSYSQGQIDAVEEVKAIPLDEVKQAREEIENLTPWDDGLVEMHEVLSVLDKLIEGVKDESKEDI